MMVKRSGSLSAAMHLRAIEGLSYQEISLVTGCSVKAGWPPSTTQHHHIDESGGGTLLFEGQITSYPRDQSGGKFRKKQFFVERPYSLEPLNAGGRISRVSHGRKFEPAEQFS